MSGDGPSGLSTTARCNSLAPVYTRLTMQSFNQVMAGRLLAAVCALTFAFAPEAPAAIEAAKALDPVPLEAAEPLDPVLLEPAGRAAEPARQDAIEPAAEAGQRDPADSLEPTPIDTGEAVKPTLVKVYAIANPPDLLSPWQALGTEKYVGSGVIIDGQRVLTNAHLVANQVSIEVKRQGMTRRYEARVAHIGHQCDLALLEVDEPGFFENVEPVELGTLPKLQDTADVYGFPIGGESISVTSGIVSRMEIGTYTHSYSDLLIVQIDAALNPGNSGGPVVAGGKIVGIAVQTMEGAENVGYMIPAPIVNHFLEDIEDGSFDGFPSLGVGWQTVESRALRDALGLRSDETGGLVNRVNAGSSVDGIVKPGDVLLAIDGNEVAEDLTIGLGEHGRITASYAVQRKHVGEEIEITIARGNRRIIQSVILKNEPTLVAGPHHDRKPTYLILGGLVFQPLSWDYLDFLYDWRYDLAYYAYVEYFRTPERRQVILLSKVLAASLNRGYHNWDNAIVKTVQGETPRDMTHLASIIDSARGDRFEIVTESDKRLVLDLAEARAQSAAILERYGVSRDRSADLSAGSSSLNAGR